MIRLHPSSFHPLSLIFLHLMTALCTQHNGQTSASYSQTKPKMWDLKTAKEKIVGLHKHKYASWSLNFESGLSRCRLASSTAKQLTSGRGKLLQTGRAGCNIFNDKVQKSDVPASQRLTQTSLAAGESVALQRNWKRHISIMSYMAQIERKWVISYTSSENRLSSEPFHR